MSQIQNKICKSSKIIATIFKIMLIALSIAIIIPIITLIWISINPNVEVVSSSLKFYSGMGISLTTRGEVIAEMSAVIVSSVLMLRLFFIAYRVFSKISKDSTPFSQFSVFSLKKIGKLMILYSFLVPLLRFIFYSAFSPATDNMSFLNVEYAMLALIFFFLTIIFQYGAELQRQSDETL